MKSTNEEIYNRLSADPTLLSYLAENPPFWDVNSTTKSTANSIVPSDMATHVMSTPFITVQEGNETIVGHRITQTFYIRCYNDIRKSYIEINQILDRVRELLDDYDFDLDDRRHVKTTVESRLAGLVAQDHQLKFKEEIYQVLVL